MTRVNLELPELADLRRADDERLAAREHWEDSIIAARAAGHTVFAVATAAGCAERTVLNVLARGLTRERLVRS